MEQLSTLINSLPPEQRSYQSRPQITRNCSLGIPSTAVESGRPLIKLTPDCTGFEFVLGELGLPLIKAYATSMFPPQTERLVVGYCSYNPEFDQRDLRPLVEAISHCDLPALKQLHLGDYFLFVNGAGATGWLGDVTPLLQHAPALQELSLVGNFMLTASLNLPELTELSVELDDCQSSLNRGPISNETLVSLLSSTLPSLEALYLDLTIDADTAYFFPQAFLQGHQLPELYHLEIAGKFADGELAKLAASPLCQRQGFKLIVEDE